jgi:hypothetical protein
VLPQITSEILRFAEIKFFLNATRIVLIWLVRGPAQFDGMVMYAVAEFVIVAWAQSKPYYTLPGAFGSFERRSNL